MLRFLGGHWTVLNLKQCVSLMSELYKSIQYTHSDSLIHLCVRPGRERKKENDQKVSPLE